jgi:hypothetical protein
MRRALLLVGLVACAPEPVEVAWALDTIRIEPSGETISGRQRWSLYDERWERRRAETRLVCEAQVELVGTAIDATACERCEVAWTVTATLGEHDCAPEQLVGLDVLDGMDGLGIGSLAPRLLEDTPRPGALGGWVRYPAEDWVAHGWAGQPAFWGGGVDEAAWDGERSFELRPAFAWELSP